MDQIASLVDMVNQVMATNYTQGVREIPMLTRYQGISQGFNSIIKFVAQHYGQEAKQYYNKRTQQDAELIKVQDQAHEEIITCLESSLCNKDIIYQVIPASSFSARTNLVDEMSDLDFLVMLKGLDDDKAICFANSLGTCQYILTDIRNRDDKSKKHWVFRKYIGDVEIEAKVRDKDGFRELLKMHQYTDNLMPKDDKIYLTYAKYLLKTQAPSAYEKLKMIYYCNAGYHGKVTDQLYPLLPKKMTKLD